ncbi:hypothetical protein DPEC_G00071330 [Dallia pectoralis]|uniref:Uncharacterized protein n=1 Tax=Dallia pectoralis TaxID=75939 RepID=A0ACC2H2D1_DALPE|nr:hypothetical protein DPEC_G00071330 [Dallia pectoralis]
MVSGQPHFVRCIKPNNDRQPSKFDLEKVLVQLRYTGVLETAKIRRQGYSHRILYAKFVNRYYILAFPVHEEPAGSPETCASILVKAKLENWVLGKTKVFLKYYHVEHLNLMVRQTTDSIVLVQAYIRGWLGAKRYGKILKKRTQSALAIQSVCRGYLAKKKFKELVDEKNKSAVKIQAHYRGHRERKCYKKKREAIEKDRIEKERFEVAKLEEDEMVNSAVVLQSNYRGYKERKILRERHKTLVGDKLRLCSTSPLPVEAFFTEEHEEEDERIRVAERDKEMTQMANQEDEDHDKAEEDIDEEDTEVSDEFEDSKHAEIGDELNAEAADMDVVYLEHEDRAATVLQSNFRGYKERKHLVKEGKIPAKKHRVTSTTEDNTRKIDGMPNPKEHSKLPEAATKIPLENKTQVRAKEQPELKLVQTYEPTLEPKPEPPITPQAKPDEEKAVNIQQSNVRGHQDRNTFIESDQVLRSKEETILGENGEALKVKARVVDLTDIDLVCNETVPKGGDMYDEEQAVVKIQSQFRGYKERKNLKATYGTAQTDMEELEILSKEVSKVSQNYMSLQQNLNEIIQAQHTNPANNGAFVKGEAVNGFAANNPQSGDLKVCRTPRRSQPPKTLNEPEDSTYYNLIHYAVFSTLESRKIGDGGSLQRSVQDDKRKPRKQGPGKLLDVDDHYYGGLPTSGSTGAIARNRLTSLSRQASLEQRQSMDQRRSTESRLSSVRNQSAAADKSPQTKRQFSAQDKGPSSDQRQTVASQKSQQTKSQRRHSRDRAVSELADDSNLTKKKRYSVSRLQSTEGQEDNPYDYRKLLRKTSQRRKLMRQY